MEFAGHSKDPDNAGNESGMETHRQRNLGEFQIWLFFLELDNCVFGVCWNGFAELIHI